jgi:hypothetical protein
MKVTGIILLLLVRLIKKEAKTSKKVNQYKLQYTAQDVVCALQRAM